MTTILIATASISTIAAIVLLAIMLRKRTKGCSTQQTDPNDCAREFEALFEHIPTGIYIRAIDHGKLTYKFSNHAIKDIYGDCFASSPLWDQQEEDYYDNLLNGRKNELTFQRTLFDPESGEKSSYECSKRLFEHSSGLCGIVTVMTDTNESNAKQHELNEARSNLVISLDPNTSFMWCLNVKDGNFYRLDQGIIAGKGTSFDNAVTMISAADRHVFTDAIERLMMGESTRETVTFGQTDPLTAEQHYYRCSMGIVKHSNGTLKRIVGIRTDITDEHFTESRNRELMLNVELAVNSTDISIIKYDVARNRYTPLYGNDIIGADTTFEQVRDMMHPDDRKLLVEQARRLLSGESSKESGTYRLLDRSTNLYRYVVCEIGGVVSKNSHKVEVLYGTCKDVTERIEQEREQDAIRVSFSSAIQLLNVVVWEYDWSTAQMKVNDGSGTMQTTIPDLKKTLNDCIHPDYAVQFSDFVDRIRKGEAVGQKTIVKFRPAVDAPFDYCELTALNRTGDDGQPTTTTGTIKNINDIVDWEERLDKQLNLLETIYRNIPIGLQMCDREGNIVMINDTCAEILGIKDKSVVTGKNIMAKEHLSEIMDDVSKTHTTQSLVSQMDFSTIGDVSEKQGTATLETTITPILDHAGETDGYMLTIADVTKRIENKQLMRNVFLKYETIFNTIASGIIIIDNYKRIVELNNAAAELFGLDDLSLVEGEQMTLLKIIPDPIKTMLTNFEPVDTIVEYDFDKVRANNYYTTSRSSKIMLHLTSRPMIDKNNTTSGTIFTFNEVTDDVRLNRHYKLLFDKLQDIIDILPVSVIIFNAEGRVILSNNRSKELFGRMVGQPNEFNIFDSQLLPTDVIEQMKRGKDQTFEMMLPARAGEQVGAADFNRPFRFTTRQLRNTDSQSDDTVLFIDSIGTATPSNEAIHSICPNSPNCWKGNLIANISHEFRTPLNAIIGFSELLTSESLNEHNNEQIKQYGRIVVSNAKQLLNLTTELVNLSQLDSGTIKIENDTIDVVALLDTIALSFSLEVSEGVSIKVDNRYRRCTVTNDSQRITQVTNNLMSNAVKFTRSGSIVLGYSVVDNGLLICVDDTGCGIEERFKRLVFDRFERFDPLDEGAGLGLPISLSIVNGMEGRIGFVSEENQGSHFWFWIPCSVIDCEPLAFDTADSQSDADNRSDGRVLVADNNPLFVEELAHVAPHCTIDYSTNGIETVEKTAITRYKMILLNAELTGVDGFEVARLIREFDLHTPLYVTSYYGNETDKQRAKESGCNGYLVRPTDDPVLKELLNRPIEKQ